MKIEIFDWRTGGALFSKFRLPYMQNQVLEGSAEDVLRIVGEFLAAGLNVMVTRTSAEPDLWIGYMIAVDTRIFQQG